MEVTQQREMKAIGKKARAVEESLRRLSKTKGLNMSNSSIFMSPLKESSAVYW